MVKVPAAISHAFQYEYWDAYRAYLGEKGEKIKPKRSRFYWQSYSLRIDGFDLQAFYNIDNCIPHLPNCIAFAYSLNIGSGRVSAIEARMKRIEYILELYRHDLEQSLGYPLYNTGNKAADGYLWLYTYLEADVRDRSGWRDQFAWYQEKQKNFHRAIKPFLDKIEVASRP